MVFVRPSHPKREAALSWVPLRQRWGYSAQLLNWCHRTLERFTVITRIFTNTKIESRTTQTQSAKIPRCHRHRRLSAGWTRLAWHSRFCNIELPTELSVAVLLKWKLGGPDRVEVMEWRWGLAGWSCIRCINYWSAESWGGVNMRNENTGGGESLIFISPSWTACVSNCTLSQMS